MTDAVGQAPAVQATSGCDLGNREPRIVISVPGVEDIDSVAELLQRAGAEITSGRRTFEVKGDLTVVQAMALMELATFRDGNSEGNQLRIEFESVQYGEQLEPLDWWAEQQRRQVSGER